MIPGFYHRHSELLGILQDWGLLSKPEAKEIRSLSLSLGQSELRVAYTGGYVHPTAYGALLGNLGFQVGKPKESRLSLPVWARTEMLYLKEHLVLPYKEKHETGEVFVWCASPYGNEQALAHIQALSGLKPRVILVDLIDLDRLIQGLMYQLPERERNAQKTPDRLGLVVLTALVLVLVGLATVYSGGKNLISVILVAWIAAGLSRILFFMRKTTPPLKVRPDHDLPKRPVFDLWLIQPRNKKLPVDFLRSMEKWKFPRYGYNLHVVLDPEDSRSLSKLLSLELKLPIEIEFREKIKRIQLDDVVGWSSAEWVMAVNPEEAFDPNWLEVLYADMQADKSPSSFFIRGQSKLIYGAHASALRYLEDRFYAEEVIPKLTGTVCAGLYPLEGVVINRVKWADYNPVLTQSATARIQFPQNLLIPLKNTRWVPADQGVLKGTLSLGLAVPESGYNQIMLGQLAQLIFTPRIMIKSLGLKGWVISVFLGLNQLSIPLFGPVLWAVLVFSLLSNDGTLAVWFLTAYALGAIFHIQALFLSALSRGQWTDQIRLMFFPLLHLFSAFFFLGGLINQIRSRLGKSQKTSHAI